MSVYSKFCDFILKNGEFAGIRPSIAGKKLIYKYKDYTVVIDTRPLKEEDLVVTVLKDDEPIYLSQATIKGAQALGIQLDEALSDPVILEDLLEKFSSSKR